MITTPLAKGATMGTWQPLSNPPSFGASTMLLLTDGTVMCQEAGGKNWWRLTPDSSGDYVNGTWSPLTPMKNTRLYYASAVLRDGRVFVAGGEYSDGGGDLDAAEVFEPLLNHWTSIPAPPGWTAIGDAPCCVLPDGRVLLGSIENNSTAIYDPDLGTWTPGPNKDDSSSEETWTLLPDETVLTVECSRHPNAEKLVGGAWVAGPDFPPDSNGKLMEAKDAPACLLPNGNVLCVAGPAEEGGNFPGPSQFFAFDGSSLNAVSNPSNSGGPPFVGRMLLVPSGQVLFASGGAQIEVYTPTGGPDPAWRPHITSAPYFIRAGQTYTIQGRQLTGLSQANSYGDDASMATNYPLVRLKTVSGNVYYCRTFDHSTMGVATGTSTQSTCFKVPFGVKDGPAELCLVANGISSQCVPAYVGIFHLHVSIDEALVNRLIGSLADGPLWVLTSHGPVPVDPWGPDIAAKAKQAWGSITQGIRALQQLGRNIETGEVPLAAKKAAEKIQVSPSGGRRRRRPKAA